MTNEVLTTDEKLAERMRAAGLYFPNRPELSEADRRGLRAKHRSNSPTHDKEAHGDKSDEWIANAVRMLMRTDLDHEAICCASRDRIMRLSLEVERLKEFEWMYKELQK